MNIRHVLLVAICSTVLQHTEAREYNIIDFGAVTDTSLMSTQAIQKAIDECNARGGGRVTIPAGTYKTGTLILKSNVNLYLEAGAVMYGSRNLADYLSLKPGFVSLRTQEATIQLIYAENAENVSISGYGTIDGQGRSFKKLTWNDEGITRPHLLRFITCRHVHIENITLMNSGCWMQHYLACEDLQITGIRVFNRNNYNNDGVDIDGCRNVTISNVITDSDDDGITLKSTSPRPCENIAISNCVISSRCNAIKLGTESNGGFKNIAISNCVVKPSAFPAPAFYGNPTGTSGISLEIVDGGHMQGIVISNIQINGTESPIFIRLGNRARPYQKDMAISNVGTLSDVSINNVNIVNAKNTGCSITGQPGYPVSNIRLSNIFFQQQGGGTIADVTKEMPEKSKDYPEATMFGTLPAFGFYIRHASNVAFENVEFMYDTTDQRPAFYAEDLTQGRFTGVQMQSDSCNVANIVLSQVRDISIQGCRVKGRSNCFVKVTGDKSSDIALIGNRIEGVVKTTLSEGNARVQIRELDNVK